MRIRRGFVVYCFSLMAGVSVVSAQSIAPARPQPPSKEAQDAAVATIREIFEDEYRAAKTDEKKSELASALIVQSRRTLDDPAGKFTLLRVARDIAIAAGDVETAIAAVEELQRHFQINTLSMRAETLSKLANPKRFASWPAEVKQRLVEEMSTGAQDAIQGGEIAAAKQLIEALEPLSRLLRNRDLNLTLQTLKKEVGERAEASVEVEQARAVLAKDPTNQAANLLVGRQLCFATGDWETGLPFLALGSDETLRELAKSELGEPATDAQKSQLADRWWELAEGADEAVEPRIRSRAVHWYRQVVGNMSGLEKVKIEKRIAKLADVPPPVSAAASKPRMPAVARRPAPGAAKNLSVTLRNSLTGHGSWAQTVAFSPDGATLASGAGDRMIIVWDVATGARKQTLRGHKDEVRRLLFLEDGTLVSGSHDQTIKFWDLKTGAETQTLEGHQGWVIDLAASPDGKFLASCGSDHKIFFWDLKTRQKVRELAGHTDWVVSIAFSPDGRSLVSAGGGHQLCAWDLRTGALRAKLPGHTKLIHAVNFSPDGNLFATACDDKTAKVWSSRGVAANFESATGPMLDALFSPDGSFLATSTRDGTMQFWDYQQNREILSVKKHVDGVSQLAFSPDGKLLASAGMEGSVKLWDISTDPPAE